MSITPRIKLEDWHPNHPEGTKYALEEVGGAGFCIALFPDGTQERYELLRDIEAPLETDKQIGYLDKQ